MIEKDNIIHYGFGIDYLKTWSTKQAFREIYQNFLDYGEYKDTTKIIKDNLLKVSITNNWNPESLDFLRIGNSNKHGNLEAIGKHGEGLKMAFLIFLRTNLNSRIFTNKYVIYPSIYIDKEIGECFCFKYKEHNIKDKNFTIEFETNTNEFINFKKGILNKEKDIIFTDSYHGSIVNKSKGEIFVGGLYVCTLENFSKAFNFPPSRIPLDRDREVPRTFDVNYNASKINEAYGQWKAIDTIYNDMQYVDKIPEEVLKEIKPKRIGNTIEYTTKNEKGETIVITNSNIKEKLKISTFFKDTIKILKLTIIKHLGLYDLLIEFKHKYVQKGTEMEQDFELILEQVK